MNILDLSIQAVAPREIDETLITDELYNIKFKLPNFSLFVDNTLILPLEFKDSKQESKKARTKVQLQ